MATPIAQPLAQQPPELQALLFEHESLSLQAAQLAGALARRRADLALMRGEAATVALSLESAKHRLDLALRAESNIRASAPPSPLPSSVPPVGVPAVSIGGGAIASNAEDNEYSKSSPRSRRSTPLGAPSDIPAKRADFLPDDGLVRALTGQLEVTRKSMGQAEHRRDALVKDIADLKSRVLEGAQRTLDQRNEHVAATAEASRLGIQKRTDNNMKFHVTPTSPNATVQHASNTHRLLSSSAAINDEMTRSQPTKHQQQQRQQLQQGYPGTSLPKLELQIPPVSFTQPGAALVRTPREDDWEERRRSSRATMERNMLRTLEDGAKSRSSFRLEHARIWRDSTMPNVLLVDDAQQSFKLGVVTERIFEGITCFTHTDSDSAMVDIRLANDLPDPLHIVDDIDEDSCDVQQQKPFQPDGVLRAKVVDKYATLCSPTSNHAQSQSQLMTADGKIIARIIAPRIALERVQKLASDASRRSSARVGRQDLSISDSAGSGSVTKQLAADISSISVSRPTVRGDPGGLQGTASGVVNNNGSYANNESNGSDKAIKSRGEAMNGTNENGVNKEGKNGQKDDDDDDDEEDVGPVLPSPKRSDSSSVLEDADFAELMEIAVPARFHECTLRLLYSTEVHGMSLRTLYSRCRTASPTLIAIRDTRGRSFGCYAAQAWRASATRYYGTGESFVFGLDNEKKKSKKKSNRVHVFKWSRENSLFQFTSGSFLAIGGGAGSHFALWVDEDLLMGTTASCATFNSPPLTHARTGANGVEKIDDSEKDGDKKQTEQSMEFNILSLEVWSFVTGRV